MFTALDTRKYLGGVKQQGLLRGYKVRESMKSNKLPSPETLHEGATGSFLDQFYLDSKLTDGLKIDPT